MSKDFSYPSVDDNNFNSKIYPKREFNVHKIEKRKILEDYKDIKDYRDSICKGEFRLREQQIILKNFISPDTPYKGLLIMHGTGTGKTCTAISIAEQFKEQVKKYNTKIFILTFGPNNRETFKEQLLFCTGDTYIKNKSILNQMSKSQKEREEKIAIYGALQYYKILSYKTFYKKVLGEKIVEKKVGDGDKIVSSYKKDKSGNIEREIVVDKISNMDNSIIIVDEAHNLTGNEYGEALKKIIDNSKNLKVILLTATPMKNLASDIIDLINFIRPKDNMIKRDKIFSTEKNYNMKMKPEGEDYLKKMAKGYVSFFRGNMPYTFADRVDIGEIPDELLFTPLVRCKMDKLQDETYDNTKTEVDDSLERSSSAVANFVFPTLNNSKSKIVGTYSTDGLNRFLATFKNYKTETLNKINKQIFNGKIKKEDLNNFIVETDNKGLSGSILSLKYLDKFSIKFHTCLTNLNKLYGEDASTAFVYSNLVKAGGIELFAEVLKENGYLEYESNGSYNINENTIDSVTGKIFQQYKKEKLDLKLFNPATYILITGGGDDGEDIPEIKQKVIREVFNNSVNKSGKFLKIVLGSKVMNEGVTLENVKEVHILDVHYNLGKVEQVIGRAIRMCKHQNVINDNYRFPKVNVYRYVISKGNNKLTSDENLYRKAELKFLLVKKIERTLKKVAIDCPLLLNGNMFPEEVEKYKDCKYPTLENKKKGHKICPAICDFEKCDFKCDENDLNEKYYDEKKDTYKNLNKKEIDFNTFNDNLADNEITLVKNIIKDLYRFKHVYVYDEIYRNIKLIQSEIQNELFDDYFLDKALYDLMPSSENDFNNFKDNIYDKYNRTGYLIKRGKYYIFQPFDENEDLPIYYRKNIFIKNTNEINLKNFLLKKYGIIKSTKEKTEKIVKKYDFESNRKYYNKEENFIVGIIDKNREGNDVFKIRPPLNKSADKKRGTGIYSLKGAVCATSKDKEYLEKALKKINPNYKIGSKSKRENICDEIKNQLLLLEKYGTSANKNKKTYVIIPSNHPTLEFPYNLEDRIKFILKNLYDITKYNFKHEVKKVKGDNVSYELIIKSDSKIDKFKSDLINLKFKQDGKSYIKKIE